MRLSGNHHLLNKEFLEGKTADDDTIEVEGESAIIKAKRDAGANKARTFSLNAQQKFQERDAGKKKMLEIEADNKAVTRQPRGR